MGKKKHSDEEDRVLKSAVMAVVILFIIGAVIVGAKMLNPRVNASAGEKKLKQFEKEDVQEIDAKIQELEKAEREADEAWQNRPNNEKFANCIVLGDSITQGLYEYNVLDASLVIAERGVETHRPDDTGLTDMVNKVIEAKPQKLFLALGMNDIVADNGDAELFIKDYQAVLDKLIEGLPDTVIYINSVLPANSSKIAKEACYGNVPDYNEKLKALCEEKKLVFIDNTELVKEEYYANDGVHLSQSYYPEWANHMAEAAEL